MGADRVDQIAAWLFEHLAQPILFRTGLIGLDELAFDAVTVFVYGLVQVVLIYVLVRPLEALAPAEAWETRRGVRVDVLYTLLSRLGVVPLVFFLCLTPLNTALDRYLRLHDLLPRQLEHLSPWLLAHPLPSFVAYLVVLDFSNYWRHRFQHRFDIWWALHSLHHSQRMLSLWADDRNHLLDDAMTWLWFALVTSAIGAPPSQFVWLVAASRMVESLAHANVRFGFGTWVDRLLVSPRFHRLHHGTNAGQRGCNFATLFPIWDVLFGTGDFSRTAVATGVNDDRDYGDGYLSQQWLGLRRLFAVRSSS